MSYKILRVWLQTLKFVDKDVEWCNNTITDNDTGNDTGIWCHHLSRFI